MRDRGSTPVKDRRETRYDDVEENDSEKMRDSSRHRSKERSKGSQRDDKDHRSGDRTRPKGTDVSKEREREIDRRKEERDDREKDRSKDKRREKEDEREKDHVKDRDRDRADKDGLREREKDRAKEKSRTREKERDKERDRGKEHEREKSKDTHKDRERDRERVTDRDRHRDSLEREKEKERHREKEADKEDGRSRERDRGYKKHRDEGHDKAKEERKDDIMDEEREEGEVVDTGKYVKGSSHDEVHHRSRKYHEKSQGKSTEAHVSTSELEVRISKMKEERLHKQPEGNSDILSWVSKSRKIEEKKNSTKEKAKAARLSKVFEEQDDINQGDFEIEIAAKHSSGDLAGVKVLHGLDKVLEGGAVVLTLKDQNILADGDLNEEADVLENVEIGEQKRRNEAYQAAKKKSGTYEDKFNEEPGFQKKMLPQYDDPAADEGITLDSTGRFTGDAEKKLEELRKRLQGVPTNNHFEDLSSSEKIVSDYYTPEEMLKFKKPPKKKKSLRKKDKLDLDALEAEAVSAGLGDLGSRNNSNREAIKEEQERKETEMRNRAYQVAYAKADEASKTLRMEQSHNEEDESSVFGDDDEELRKSLARARKVALKKQDESGTSLSGPEAIAGLAFSNPTADDDQTLASGGEMQESKVVFTEMEEFVGGLQLDEEAHKPDSEDVFMEEDLAPNSSDQEMEDADGGWTEVKNSDKEELLPLVDETESSIVPGDTIHEPPVGKGLSGALKMLKDRGTLKENVEWGGRNMDKKKSKLRGIHEHVDGEKEIRLERTDEYGRILTPKEAFRLLSHKFHGKGPGKMKQEKRMRQYEEELKIKRMKNSDTPSQSVERMRDAQAQLKTPYLVLSGNVKPGQTSDPSSGFATVERNLPGSLTPMLGDRKVEHFLGIKRKAESGNMGPPPSRKPDPKSQAKSENNNGAPKKPEKK